MSKYFVAAICLFAGFVCRAQIVLNGKIIDGSTGEELIGASVVEKGALLEPSLPLMGRLLFNWLKVSMFLRLLTLATCLLR